jgi:signal transduction histidine kinase
VAKHARTQKAEVTLICSEAGVSLLIRDSGAGCSTKGNPIRSGLGLVSMKERVRLLHGTFAFRSKPGYGTAVEVSIPLTA